MNWFRRQFSNIAFPRITPAVRVALIVCLVGFLAQLVALYLPYSVLVGTAGGRAGVLRQDLVTFLFALSGSNLAGGFLWTPVTYMFLHGSLAHLLLNSLGLYVIGSALEAQWGARRFWLIFGLSGVVGGLGWAVVQGLHSPVPCVGASAGVLGLVGAYAVLRPRDRFVLFVPIPVTLSARNVALLIAGANAIDLAFGRGQVAYLAHLVGIFTGALIAWLISKEARQRRDRFGGWPSAWRHLGTWRFPGR